MHPSLGNAVNFAADQVFGMPDAAPGSIVSLQRFLQNLLVELGFRQQLLQQLVLLFQFLQPLVLPTLS